MDDTRQLPIDAHGNIRVELLPNVKAKLLPMNDHLIFVVTNQAGESVAVAQHILKWVEPLEDQTSNIR